MNADAIVALLNDSWHFAPDSRVDLEWTGEQIFRATEVRSDLSIGQRLLGYVNSEGAVVSSQEPELTFEQAKVYDRVLPDFSERLTEARASGQRKFLLMRDGDYPELFHPLDCVEVNIGGNVKEDKLPVWVSLKNMLQLCGYRPVKMKGLDSPWEIWAEPLNIPR